MQDFIRAQGISDDERDAYQPTPETLELINYRMDAVLGDATYHIGAAAVMIASEGQSLETRAGEPRHVMLAKAYGLTEEDTRFFAVHQQEDIGHVAEGVDLVAELCTTPEMQQEALFAVEHTCKLFWGMYESAAQRYYAIANGQEVENAAE
jgi:pyrroloquinoline-quinone synthase